MNAEQVRETLEDEAESRSEDDFFPATFLNYGKNYAGARDKYVYTYGGPWMSGVHHHLARAGQDKIKDRAAFEFFQGLDAEGHPVWTPQICRRRPVFRDIHSEVQGNEPNNAGAT